MPLFTVTMRTGRTADEKDAISRALHEASVNAGYPDNDTFQRFFSFEKPDLRIDLFYPNLPRPRTEGMLMIEVSVSSGTESGKKRQLLNMLIEALQSIGVDPNDVLVFFQDIDRTNSSFGGGRLAPPLATPTN